MPSLMISPKQEAVHFEISFKTSSGAIGYAGFRFVDSKGSFPVGFISAEKNMISSIGRILEPNVEGTSRFEQPND